MKLIEWRKQAGLSRVELAKRLGVDDETIRRYEMGERFPRQAIRQEIRIVTGGAVTADDFDEMIGAA